MEIFYRDVLRTGLALGVNAVLDMGLYLSIGAHQIIGYLI